MRADFGIAGTVSTQSGRLCNSGASQWALNDPQRRARSTVNNMTSKTVASSINWGCRNETWEPGIGTAAAAGWYVP